MPAPAHKFTQKAIAAINAVEGLHLSEQSKARLKQLESKGLNPDAQVKAIREAYRKRSA